MTAELIICPLCNKVIHRHTRSLVTTSIRVPSRYERSADVFAYLQQVANDERAQELADAEAACVMHCEEQHRVRLWLWRRLGWEWLMTWPRRRRGLATPDQQFFEPLEFLERKSSDRLT